MKIAGAALLFLTVVGIAGCSEKSEPDRETHAVEAPGERVSESEADAREGELQPAEDKVAEDCVAFVRSTKVVPARAASTGCPGCPAGGSEVLSFRQMKTEAVSCSSEMCTVLVTVRAVFNPGSGETIAGGLTAWIPPEQRTAYLAGQTPAGEQAFRIQITYKRSGAAWRVVEFDRAPVE